MHSQDLSLLTLIQNGFFRTHNQDLSRKILKLEVLAFKNLAQDSLDFSLCLSALKHSLALKVFNRFAQAKDIKKYKEALLENKYLVEFIISEQESIQDNILNIQKNNNKLVFSYSKNSLISKFINNLEQVYCTAIICGIMEKTISFAEAHTKDKNPLYIVKDFHYTQEKLYRISSMKSVLMGLIEQIIKSSKDIVESEKKINVLYNITINEGLNSCLELYEAMASKKSKIVRDIMAFKTLNSPLENKMRLFYHNDYQEPLAA